MKLEDQIYFGCAAYSMIHPNRAAELNHLFLVIGNGYVWENGQLVAVCDDQTYKNGKPMSLNAAINRVFRNRREAAKRRKAHDRKMARDRKLHPEKYPEMSDTVLDKLIERAVEETRKVKAKDPVAFEAQRKRQAAEFAVQKRKWREEEKWEYRVPADIKKRTAYQDTVPGAHDGYNDWYPACEYSKIVTFPENVQDDYLRGIIEVCQLVLANPPVADGRTSTERTVEETLAVVKKALIRATKLAENRI
jgi:hypothetical protein